MQTKPSAILRKENVIFDLICSTDELHTLKHELSIQDMEQIEEASKKLRSLFFEKQQPSPIYQLSF